MEFIMSYNLPDGVTDADIDRAMGGDVTDEQDKWLAEVEKAQEAVKEIVSATIDVLIKRRLMIPQDELEKILEAVAESLYDDIDHAVSSLEEEGFEKLSPYPEGHKAFIAAEHERLVDTFRPKRLDGAAILRDALRPVPTNPATVEDLASHLCFGGGL